MKAFSRPSTRILLPSLLTVGLFLWVFYAVFLPGMERSSMNRRMESARMVCETGWSLIEHYHERELDGELSRAEAQNRVLERLRSVRYGADKKDYLWVNDLEPRMIMHPYRRDLEGQNVRDYRDPAGGLLFQEFVRVAQLQQEGFVRYTWQHQDDPTRFGPKVSYIKLFAPWGWIVGTGLYVDDVRAEIRAMQHQILLASTGIAIVIALLCGFMILQAFAFERRQQQAAAQLNELQDQLHQSQKMDAVGKLAGGVAHDFNNLLTTITGNLALAVADLGPSHPVYHYLTEVQQAVKRAAALTRQLLAFGRKQIFRPQPVQLNGILAGMDHLLRRTVGEHYRLTLDLDPHLPVVRADPGQIEQVIVNLVVNARDAQPQGGPIEIVTAQHQPSQAEAREAPDLLPGPCLRLTVRDAGEGMTDEVRRQAFEPFFTTKPVGRGTGLGLSSVYGIIRRHGGHITIDSAPNQGTAIHILLPATTAPIEAAAAESARRTTPHGHGELILLVEDDHAVRQVASQMLRTLGYRVQEAPDAPTALTLVREGSLRPDLLLTDVIMPRVNGRELAEALHELLPGLRVLYTSGYSAEIISSQGLLLDGVRFLAKPYELNDVALQVHAALAGQPPLP